MSRIFQHIAVLSAFLFALPASAQVLPSSFTEETSIDSSNFEVYSQKGNLSRRANVFTLKKYMDQNVSFSGDTLYLTRAEGNTAIYLGAYDETLSLSGDNLILNGDTISIAAYQDSIYYEAVNNRICLIAGSCADLPTDTATVVVNNTGSGQDLVKSMANDTATIRQIVAGDNMVLSKDGDDNITAGLSLFVEPGNADDTTTLALGAKLNFEEIDCDFNFVSYDTTTVIIGTDNSSDSYSHVTFNDLADSLMLSWESRVLTSTGTQLGNVIITEPTTFLLQYDQSDDVYYASIIYDLDQIKAEVSNEYNTQRTLDTDSIVLADPATTYILGVTTTADFSSTNWTQTDSSSIWSGAGGSKFLVNFQYDTQLYDFDLGLGTADVAEVAVYVNDAKYAASSSRFSRDSGAADMQGQEYIRFGGTCIIEVASGAEVEVKVSGYIGGFKVVAGNITLMQIK